MLNLDDEFLSNEEEKNNKYDWRNKIKDVQSKLNEYNIWLQYQFFVEKKKWVLIPQKYSEVKNCQVCLIKCETFNSIIGVILN